MKLILIALTILTLAGCAQYSLYQDGKLAKAKAETQDEITQITRDYRLCLQANAAQPEKQKECAVYQQFLLQLQVSQR